MHGRKNIKKIHNIVELSDKCTLALNTESVANQSLLVLSETCTNK